MEIHDGPTPRYSQYTVPEEAQTATEEPPLGEIILQARSSREDRVCFQYSLTARVISCSRYCARDSCSRLKVSYGVSASGNLGVDVLLAHARVAKELCFPKCAGGCSGEGCYCDGYVGGYDDETVPHAAETKTHWSRTGRGGCLDDQIVKRVDFAIIHFSHFPRALFWSA